MFKLFLLLFIACHTLLFSSNIVEVKISKIHGLTSFVQSLSGVGQTVKSYKSIYLEHYDANDLDTLKSIVEKVYLAKIYEYKNETNLYNVIKQQSSFINTVEELEEHVLKYKTSLSIAEIKSYFTFLERYLPIYEKLVFNDSITKLEDVKLRLEKFMATQNYDALIYKSANFYGVQNEDVAKITLSLYPITQGDSTLAFMLGNVESIGILVYRDKLNLQWLLSATIFHEIAHTFYKQNYDYIKQFLYKNNFKKYNEQTIFNESLATAFGAGWVFYELTSTQSNGRWYNNKTYDETAKSIYPLLSQYIKYGKKIDNEFVKKVNDFVNITK